MKCTFFSTFKNQYKKVNVGKAAAASLCNLLLQPILNELQSYLESEIVQDMIASKTFCHSKRAFKVQVLTDLVERNDFDLYTTYLWDIKFSLKYWAEHYVTTHCNELVNGKSKVVILAEQKL